MGFSLDEYAKKRRGTGDPSASLRLEAEAMGRAAGVEAAPRKAGGGFSLDEYHRQKTGGAKSQTLGNLPHTTTPEAGEKSVKRLDQKTVAAPTAPMGLADLQAEKRWVAGELEKGRKRREAVTAQPASAQKAPMGLAAIKELDRSLQARRDYGVYKATGETPDDPEQIRGMQRLAQKELEEAREKERKAGAAYQAKTGPASTYGGQGRAGLEPAPTEYGGRGEPAVTGRKELDDLLTAQRERAAAKGRTLDLPEVYGAAVRQKKWDAMPTDLGELKARKETVTAERDEAGKEMRRLWAERYALGEDPARAAERAELTAQYDTAAAVYKEKDLELTRLGQRQYGQRNEQAFGRMSGDEDMVELFQSAREIQSDMDQILAYMTNSRRGGAETPAARKFVDRVKEKYGITASGQGELQRVYGQLSQRLNAASGQLSEEGYDFRDMDVYAGREEKAREQAQRNEQTAQFAEEHPVIASAASGVASLAQWADLGNMDWGRGKPGDPDYIPPDTSAMGIVSYVQTVRGTVGRKIETQTDAELFGRNVGSFLYQTGMSMADSGLSIATLGPGSIYLMGANAAVNTSKEIVDRGGTSSQAFWGGLAAGAAEMLFEKVSVDRLLTPKSVADWRGVVRELLTQGGVEASEEVCTEIANILSDTAIMGANSNFANAVRDYQAQGMTAEQAKRRAYLDQLGQVAEAGLGGFVSGVGMAGGKVAVDYAENSQQWKLNDLYDKTLKAYQKDVKTQEKLAREAEVLRGIPLTKSLGEAGRTGLTNAIETRLAQGTFTEKLDPLTLAEGYQEVYLAGLNGVELEPGDVPTMAGPNAELLSPTERMQAYYNGVNDAKARVELNKRRAKFATVAGTEKGLVWDAEGWVEHHLDAQVADRINETAKRLGVRVAFADSLAGGLANGQIVEADIRISKDADQPWMVVFGHEVGHWLEETAPEAYQTLRKFTSQRRMAEIEGMMELYDRAGRELIFDDALKELVNDDIGRMIAEPQILQSFIEANKNDRTLLQKVADAFRALWQRLTGKDRQQVKTAEEALLAALKASEAQAAKLERAGQVMDFDQGQGAEGGEYSIKYDVNNTPFVTVEEDILAGVPEEEWLPTVRSVLQERFPDGVTVARSHIKINAVTTGELTRSGYTRWLRDSTPDIYADKFRAAANMDEVLLAARDYVGEGLKHPRKDNIKEFARGTVQLRVGKNDYIADVVVGTTAGGKLVLYDLVNILPTTITEKKQSQAGPSSTNGTQPRTPEIASETTVTHPTEDVNGDLSLKGATAVGEEVVRLEEQGRQEGWSREQLQGEIRAAVSQVLEDLAKEYGTIKPGENPVREVAVPRKTAKDEKVSQTVRTILEAGATPEAAIPSIEELTAKGEFSYEALSDKTAIERAEQSINHKGWGASLAEWYETVRSGKVSKDNTAVGWALYNHAVNGGDIQTAMDILQSMVRHQRNAAQAVQATRILKQLAPEAQLYGVQRSVESLQEELNERFGDGKGPQLVIDQELAERLMEAQDQEERDVVLRDIYRDIGRQMPSTFLDRWNAWRYLSMLGNPRTHVRNIVGNAGFAPVVLAKDMTATAIERAVYAVSGGRLERSKGLVGLGKQGRGLLAAAWGDYAHVKDAALGGGKYGEFQHANKYIEEGRTVFTSKPGKALEAARRANSTALDAEDAWFSQPHYAYAMAQYCAANGITEDVIRAGDGGALGKAREYAIWEAQKATYRDTNALSQLLGGLGRDLRRSKNAVSRAAGVAVEGILPFRKTPANILARGLEYSPLGLVKSLSYDLAQVRKGNMTGAEAIDNISAGLTGTGLLALGVYLAAQGLLRGKGSGDDKEKELEKLQGHQDYALELGDVSVTLDWLAPEALPLFIGANLWETLQRDGDVTMSGVLEAVSNVSDPLLEMSCLQSLNDVFDSVGYASENELNPLTQGLVSAATSYLTQGLPTIFGQAERVAETRRETTYTSKDAFLTGDMQYFLGKVMNKLPGEFQQIPFVDAWGRTEETGSLGERAFGNFLNPAYVSEIEESGMERELVRLYEATGENVFPGRAKKYVQVNGTRKELTAEEYVDYATRKGRTARKLVTALTRAKGYAGLKDGEKAEAVADTYKYAEQMARKRVAKDYAPDSWVTKARTAEKEYGIPVETYILLRNRTAGLESIKGKDGESIANSKGLQIMEVVYDNTPGMGDKQRGYLFEALGAGKSIQHYNKAKVKEELGRMRK